METRTEIDYYYDYYLSKNMFKVMLKQQATARALYKIQTYTKTCILIVH